MNEDKRLCCVYFSIRHFFSDRSNFLRTPNMLERMEEFQSHRFESAIAVFFISWAFLFLFDCMHAAHEYRIYCDVVVVMACSISSQTTILFVHFVRCAIAPRMKRKNGVVTPAICRLAVQFFTLTECEIKTPKRKEKRFLIDRKEATDVWCIDQGKRGNRIQSNFGCCFVLPSKQLEITVGDFTQRT